MSHNHPHHPVVPSRRDVIPGASVHVVLKQDQPTGRTVSGIVRDVLTSGNHPRGIKVRLADGRVGRVQSIAAAAAAGSASGEPGRDGGDGGVQGGGLDGAVEVGGRAAWASDGGRDIARGGGSGGMRRGMVRDARMDPDEPPPVEIGLDAYIKPAKQRKRKGKGKGTEQKGSLEGGSVEQPRFVEDGDGGAPLKQHEELARCPVCHDFEGDEAAVAHHVASHFN
ncbi:hypothetical protein GE09DRAFT_1227542 [Coniochaeta sp. 2T2.1]|nr:hypothetical protein GE09DRAFT_1227542 [Coniochaeta sp. 2T2.1]